MLLNNQQITEEIKKEMKICIEMNELQLKSQIVFLFLLSPMSSLFGLPSINYMVEVWPTYGNQWLNWGQFKSPIITPF